MYHDYCLRHKHHSRDVQRCACSKFKYFFFIIHCRVARAADPDFFNSKLSFILLTNGKLIVDKKKSIKKNKNRKIKKMKSTETQI